MMVLVSVLHVGGIFVWLAALLYPLMALKAQPMAYLESLHRVRNWIIAAMTLSVITGAIKIISLGGFKALPTPFHVKIALALVMLVITLLQFYYFLPRAENAMTTGQAARDVGLLKGLTLCATLSVICATAILCILAYLGNI